MSVFRTQLAKLQPRKQAGRRWVLVPYDQLNDGIGVLAREPAEQLGIVLVESRWKARQRPYHRHKLALVLTNLRHFALEQAKRGVAVRHVTGDKPWHELLTPVVRELGPLRVMRPAERELREDLAPMVRKGTLVEVPHEGWLTDEADFAGLEGPPWRMDAFYRGVRKRTGILMEHGKPVGGRFSFDGENREPWRGAPTAPQEPTFACDAVTEEVVELVEREFADHPGSVRKDHLPATAAHAQQLWAWARKECLEHFGPYEDAMSTQSTGLFHTRISPLLNLHRLLPRDIVADTLAMDLPLASKEGFVRQVLGWREFVRHVHEATDGFRRLPDGLGIPEAGHDLPQAYWGKASGLHCLDAVVADVWREAYSHHITRLMVLGNIATLLAVEPRQVSDWFWAAYADAYDWVVEPNVIAMATHGAGTLMTTKPYVSGAGYIHRMSDYCKGCAFDPKRDCPLTRLYWRFLHHNRACFAGNQRMAIPLQACARRSPQDRDRDERTFEALHAALAAGTPFTPANLPGGDAAAPTQGKPAGGKPRTSSARKPRGRA
ncbi:MAG: hypothetical protein RL148_2176 [Planctomycetota bacterium]